ncbi:DUF455 family protein [Cohnella sp. CFH 77786]|uniref:DUF455 family protein n=1 Tax=Cohnella sp. CFH 77786 TaxID=2662265 RepID=UPI001C60F41E|nr:DUF455 family protein [Cohnella sp. CFH 77786]
MTEILRPEDTANRLTAILWHEFELSRMAAGWVPAVRRYEHKLKLGRFHYVHNRNVRWLHERIRELPGVFQEKRGTPPVIREAFERLSTAAGEADFLYAYLFAVDQVYAQYRQLYETLDPLLDMPTADQLELAMGALPAVRDWLSGELRSAVSKPSETWTAYTAAVWVCMNNELEKGNRQPSGKARWPQHPVSQPAGPVPSESAWDDEEFPLYVKPERAQRAYDDPSMSPLHDSVKQMHFINATEISAAEMLCYVYYGVQKMPLAFYYDLARHNWDEFRHSEMGVRRLRQLGCSTKDFLFTKGSPGGKVAREWFAEMYAGLTMVAEPCSFIKKKKSAEAFRRFGDELSAAHCEFDMADERKHVDFGKKWGPELYRQLGDMITAEEMSERARVRRLKQLEAGDEEEIRRLVKSFPAFCGFSTVELNYDSY